MKIEIVNDISKRMEKSNRHIHAVADGKAAHKQCEHTLIFTPDTFCQTFTPQRLRMLLFISVNPGNNITSLAAILNRKYEAVHRDITYLAENGLIKVRHDQKSRIPYVDGKIELPAIGSV